MSARMNSTQVRLRDAAMRLFAERGVAQVSISDLAEAAGVARGTIYNNFPSVETLFGAIATQLTAAMQARIEQTAHGVADPARRLSNGVRLFIRQAHDEPSWGRFVLRFGASTPTLRELLDSALAKDLRAGIQSGRFSLRLGQLESAVAVLSGGVLAAISLVLEGHRTWRDASADTAEFILRAVGVDLEEARELAGFELPPLLGATEAPSRAAPVSSRMASRRSRRTR